MSQPFQAGIPPGGGSPNRSNSSLFGDIGRLARSTGALVRDHLLLARVELKQEGKRVATHVVVGLLALPFALTALIMLSTALAIGLSRWVGGGWAFLIVGALDTLIASLLATYAALKLKEERGRTLAHTKEELKEDRRSATSIRRQVRLPAVASPSEVHRPSYDGQQGVHFSDRQ